MPLYDYQCKVCGYKFEEIKPMSSRGSLKGSIKCQSVEQNVPRGYSILAASRYKYNTVRVVPA